MSVKIFAMDVDGTLTDGRIYMGATGELMKAFHVHDGQGIKQLMAKDIIPAIITARRSEIVLRRCEELGITEVWQEVSDKVACLTELCQRYGVGLDNAAYIGDDLGDLGCMKISGLSFCPADAVNEVKRVVTVILKHNGGEGAVREASDWILNGGTL